VCWKRSCCGCISVPLSPVSRLGYVDTDILVTASSKMFVATLSQVCIPHSRFASLDLFLCSLQIRYVNGTVVLRANSCFQISFHGISQPRNYYSYL
jgi:hypothetical protein